MISKQAGAMDDAAAAAESISGIFRAMKLPKLADTDLYLGMPLSMLENLHGALCEQQSEDDEKKFLNRMKYAGIFRERAADTFKWDDDTYPVAEPGAIEEALSIGFIRQLRSLIVAGPPGAGKTLLATIIACKAIRAGFSVHYRTAHDIATELREAKSGKTLTGCIKKLQARDVLVVEDVTFATFDKPTAQAFISVMDKRYGRKTTIITSNGNINEWAASFPDGAMGSAVLGRFYEDAILINMNGAEDMRLKKAKGRLCGSRAGSGDEGGARA